LLDPVLGHNGLVFGVRAEEVQHVVHLFLLQPLAGRRYTSPVVERPSPTPTRRAPRPMVVVEKRALTAYSRLAGGVALKTPAPSRRDRLRHILADLRMPGALEALDAILQGVEGAALTTPEAIEQLLSAQIQLRSNRRLQAASDRAGCRSSNSSGTWRSVSPSRRLRVDGASTTARWPTRAHLPDTALGMPSRRSRANACA
jgi:hypothetical protein